MSTFRDITQNYRFIAVCFFQFKSQTDVRFVIRECSVYPSGINVHLSKSDLIECINYFLVRLNRFSFSGSIKQGFNLSTFKYFELSVYLHGILQLYCSKVGLDSVNELLISRFSRLPHDVLKAEKETLVIDCVLIHNAGGAEVYVCCPYRPFVSDTFEGLKSLVRKSLPLDKYILVFRLLNELPF